MRWNWESSATSRAGLERGLMEPDFSAYLGTKHAGEEVLVLERQNQGQKIQEGRGGQETPGVGTR